MFSFSSVVHPVTNRQAQGTHSSLRRLVDCRTACGQPCGPGVFHTRGDHTETTRWGLMQR